MTEEWIIKTLRTLGFGRCDAEVYLFLLDKGPQLGRDIGASLNLPNWKLYRILAKLKKARIVSSSAHHPTVFSSVDYEKVIEQFVETKRAQARALQENREQLLSNWRAKIMKNSSDAYTGSK